MATQTLEEEDEEEAYDVSLLVSPATPELDVTCFVCLDLLRRPQLTACCGHHLCESCLKLVQAGGTQPSCPLCKEPNVTGMLNKGLQRKIKSLAIHCPRKSRGCSWTGEIRSLRGHLAKTEREGECRYVRVLCGNCGELIERRNLNEHEEIECSKHPSVDLVDLSRKVKRLERENTELKLKVDRLQLCQSTNTEVIASLRAEIETLKQEVTRDGITSGIASISLSPTNDSRIPIPISNRTIPYQFTFTDYERRLASPEIWFSDQFYTHPNGYKFTMRVAPEGLGNGRATHVSVHAYLMRGEHDDTLQWPLRGTITVQLLNQASDQFHYEQTSEFTNRTPMLYCAR